MSLIEYWGKKSTHMHYNELKCTCFKHEHLQEAFDKVREFAYTEVMSLLQSFTPIEGAGLCSKDYKVYTITFRGDSKYIRLIFQDCYTSLRLARSMVRKNMKAKAGIGKDTIFITPFIAIQFVKFDYVESPSKTVSVNVFEQEAGAVLDPRINQWFFSGLNISDDMIQNFAYGFGSGYEKFFISPIYFDVPVEFQFELNNPCPVTYRLFDYILDVSQKANNCTDIWSTGEFVDFVKEYIYKDKGGLLR